jgi:hypothetical protein
MPTFTMRCTWPDEGLGHDYVFPWTSGTSALLRSASRRQSPCLAVDHVRQPAGGLESSLQEAQRGTHCFMAAIGTSRYFGVMRRKSALRVTADILSGRIGNALARCTAPRLSRSLASRSQINRGYASFCGALASHIARSTVFAVVDALMRNLTPDLAMVALARFSQRQSVS